MAAMQLGEQLIFLQKKEEEEKTQIIVFQMVQVEHPT